MINAMLFTMLTKLTTSQKFSHFQPGASFPGESRTGHCQNGGDARSFV